MKKVFISSTYIDLKDYREAVQKTVKELELYDISMERFGARDNRPKEECLELIEKETDLFIGIYAYRYGYIVEGDNESILEHEYNKAKYCNIPCLFYLIDENSEWLPSNIDTGEKREKLMKLKEKLMKEKIVARFTTIDDLAKSVSNSVSRHLLKIKSIPALQGLYHQPSPGWAPPEKNAYRYKIVAFDFDGTLLRGPGFEFSWEILWEGLKYSKSIRSELKREYRSHLVKDNSKKARIEAYDNWCNKTTEYFKERKLTMGKLRELIEPLQLAQNCRAALKKLKEEGFVTAIISGGINIFLEEKFPDYKDYFDFVFINELIFDNQGNLQSVVSSAFDFQGKAEALDLICEKTNCSEKETVFVGDHFNDETIMLRVDRAIAFPANDDIASDVSHFAVKENDLNMILPYVLIE